MFQATQLALVAGLLVLSVVDVSKGENDTEVAANEESVRAAARAYLDALQSGDVETLKKSWTADGEYVDAFGQVFKVQELIAGLAGDEKGKAIFADQSLPQSTLRFVTPDVAVEHGPYDCDPTADGRPQHGGFIVVWVKRNGQWLLDNLRETIATRPMANDHLQQLSWLIGEWVGVSDGATILVSSRWSDGGYFILREFLVQAAGYEPVNGVQRIGWDASTGEIKSWMFDSQGSVGSGSWRLDGDRWIVHSKETTADGKKSDTTAIYSPGNEEGFVWEVKNAKLANIDLPAVRVEFKRAEE